MYYQKNITLFSYFGLKFYFTPDDQLPIHVHISAEDVEARYQIFPKLQLVENGGLNARDLRLAEMAMEENRDIIIIRWKIHFKYTSTENLL